MSRILITGCLGTIGIFLTNKLLNLGYKIIGIDNCNNNSESRLNIIIESSNFLFFNNSKVNIESIFQQYDIKTIIHLAGKTSPSESERIPEQYIDANIILTMSLLRWANQYNVDRFIFASSSTVYGDLSENSNVESDQLNPQSIYGITKSVSEGLIYHYFKYYGLKTICLRLYNFYAPIKYEKINSFIPAMCFKILNNESITLYNNGEIYRQFVHIDNIIESFILALKTDNNKCFGESFNISVEDNPISLLELIKLLYNELEGSENYILLDKIPIGDILVSHADVTKAKDLLEYSVQKNQIDGILEYIKWFKNIYM